MLDERSKNYLDAIRKNVGWLGYNAGWSDIEEILEKAGIADTAKLQLICTYKGYVNANDIEIYSYYKDDEKRYCAQIGYQTDIDDYCIETHIFSKKPTEKDVFLVRDINNLIFSFECRGLMPTYICWECGNKTHWLDTDGDFEQKKHNLKEVYCGC